MWFAADPLGSEIRYLFLLLPALTARSDCVPNIDEPFQILL